MDTWLRVVVEFAVEEDPDFERVMEDVKAALAARYREVTLREATTFGPDESYEDWRGGWKIQLSSFGSATGYLFGATYPVAAVPARDVARVYDAFSRAE